MWRKYFGLLFSWARCRHTSAGQARSQDFTLGRGHKSSAGALFSQKVDDLFSRRPQNLSSPNSITLLNNAGPTSLQSQFFPLKIHSVDDWGAWFPVPCPVATPLVLATRASLLLTSENQLQLKHLCIGLWECADHTTYRDCLLTYSPEMLLLTYLLTKILNWMCGRSFIT